MSKRNKIPPLQKDILILLGENGPMTKNEVAETLKKSYKNILFSFKSLEKKKLIEVSGYKNYRNQKFPQYWLSWMGIIEAYSLGASIENLKAIEQSLNPQKEAVDLFFDLLRAFGRTKAPKVLDMIEFVDGQPRLATVNITIWNKKEARRMLNVIKRYKKVRENVKKSLREILQELE